MSEAKKVHIKEHSEYRVLLEEKTRANTSKDSSQLLDSIKHLKPTFSTMKELEESTEKQFRFDRPVPEKPSHGLVGSFLRSIPAFSFELEAKEDSVKVTYSDPKTKP